MNGAGIIHDVELAIAGHTSEDVATAIDDGSLGMAEDTAVFLGEALAESRQDSDGLGLAVGRGDRKARIIACKSGCNYYLTAETQRTQRKYFF
jgi:hypothetical protein